MEYPLTRRWTAIITTISSLFSSHPRKRKTSQDTEVSTPESTGCREVMRTYFVDD